MIIPKETAKKIFDILVKEADARPYEEEAFCKFIADNEHYFTFNGKLGFRGKFFNCKRRWYVNCPLEDMGRDQMLVIDSTNKKLAALHKEWKLGEKS